MDLGNPNLPGSNLTNFGSISCDINANPVTMDMVAKTNKAPIFKGQHHNPQSVSPLLFWYTRSLPAMKRILDIIPHLCSYLSWIQSFSGKISACFLLKQGKIWGFQENYISNILPWVCPIRSILVQDKLSKHEKASFWHVSKPRLTRLSGKDSSTPNIN